MVAMTPAPVKPLVTTPILNQLDIRVGSIQSVQDDPGADKLVQFRVNLGDHTPTIVASLKQEGAFPQDREGLQKLQRSGHDEDLRQELIGVREL